MLSKKVIAAFDFDGTITTKDTLFDFLKFYKGSFALGLGMLLVSPFLMAYYLGLITNHEAKEKLLAYFIKGKSYDDFSEKCKEYESEINQICHQQTLDRLKWHQEQGHEVLIISASLENWIKPWAESKGVSTVLATQIEVKDNIITGRFSSRNCFGQEKVNRLKALYPEKDYLLYAYGDSSGDKELLEYADFPTLYKRK